ncbi:uncharacterized protein L969DRAFT_17588 [Mixia osmundae IAM 14324]|uniref:uncharacterized protein n=1 Tax=Mixia osmundae (strain CBS 9802 / IAM 14324 / JCM 22182 / KY 12970) TaxID=764103 RepID=UPI0004A55700|nr:uncharacterized protein L969DRAFT_17588 [Mixia osmundae IAM 14324]KEI39779.1 hypothetical protein L969DRAFT_17588 [Mixia osmundae IAM 14324]
MLFANIISAVGLAASLVGGSPILATRDTAVPTASTAIERGLTTHPSLPAEHDWALTFSSPGNDAWTLYFSLAWDPATKSYNKLNYFLPSHGGAAHYRGSGFNQQTPESTWTFERGNIYAITLVVRYAQDDGTVVKYSVISGGFNGEDFNHTDLTIDGVVISKL